MIGAYALDELLGSNPFLLRPQHSGSAVRVARADVPAADSAHALETRTELLQGEMPQALTAYLAELETPLLVLGASHLEPAAALLTAIRTENPQVPVLLVYREAGV